MHDLLEGTANNDLGLSLNYFINEKKIVKLESFNFKIKFFHYPAHINKPPLISNLRLKSEKLKMSAAEMKFFILNGTLMFGELFPRRNQHWN